MRQRRDHRAEKRGEEQGEEMGRLSWDSAQGQTHSTHSETIPLRTCLAETHLWPLFTAKIENACNGSPNEPIFLLPKCYNLRLISKQSSPDMNFSFSTQSGGLWWLL